MTDDDRSNPVVQEMTLADYITGYRNTNMYLISSIPAEVR